HRKSTGNALGHDHDVRLHLPMLAAEPLSRPTEPALHLIEYKQYPMLVAKSAQPLQVSILLVIAGGRNDVSALTTDRFHDDGCHRIRFHLVVKHFLEQIEALQLAATWCLTDRAAIAVRIGDRIDAAGQRLVALTVMRFGSGQRRG